MANQQCHYSPIAALVDRLSHCITDLEMIAYSNSSSCVLSLHRIQVSLSLPDHYTQLRRFIAELRLQLIRGKAQSCVRLDLRWCLEAAEWI